MLTVSPIHEVYYEISGNPDGYPVVFLHGGPGGSTSPRDRRFFDPEFYKIILFDQRGCGMSMPTGELRENTIDHLISDMEMLRESLGIERWLIFGGSWGSTLGLYYAVKHPERVSGMILRGIFLCSKRELNWLYASGANHIFPEEWNKYFSIFNNSKQNILSVINKELQQGNRKQQLEAARSLTAWGASVAKLYPGNNLIEAYSKAAYSLPLARIKCHYFLNGGFLTNENYILENAPDKIKDKPLTIVHGRYDMVSPVESAYLLSEALPEAKLEIVPDAGHSLSEPGIIDALVRATDDFKGLL